MHNEFILNERKNKTMKIVISQGVKISGEKSVNHLEKEYTSTVIPHIGNSIEDLAWVESKLGLQQ